MRLTVITTLVLLTCVSSLVRSPQQVDGATISRGSVDLPVAGTADLRAATTRTMLANLKLMNYYPAQYNWAAMWTHWSPATIDGDFALVAGLHANTVRIILQAWTIGYPAPNPLMIDRMAQLVDIAARHGLRVQFTLFDWWNRYDDLSGSRQWLAAVLGLYAHDPRIAFVELQNEVDPTNEAFVTWARQMILYFHTVFPAIPLTISVYGLASLQRLIADLAPTPLDFADYHYYGSAWMAAQTLRQAAQSAAPLPLFVGETGFSTVLGKPRVSGLPVSQQDLEAYQDYYFRAVGFAAQSLALPQPAVWTLRDFLPGSLTWEPTASPEYGYGIFRTDGSAKPVAAAIGAAYGSGAIDTSFDNGFELCVPGAPPLLWRYADASPAQFSCDSTNAHSGNASVRASDTGGAQTGTPSLFLTPISAPIVPGQVYSLTIWAMGRAATGSTYGALDWYGANGALLASAASPSLPSGTTTWTELRVQSKAPAGAAFVQMRLISSRNQGTAWFDDVEFQ